MTLMKPQKNSGLATVDVTSTKDQHNEDSRTVETATKDRSDKQRVVLKWSMKDDLIE